MPDQETKKRILVVEDDPDSRAAICIILESLGYSPVSFGLATEAVTKLHEINFDLAMLDIMMPGMDGYELLKEIRKLAKFKDTPVFMVTAKDTPEETLEGYRFGADYYISKPFTSQQLSKGIDLFLKPAEEE